MTTHTKKPSLRKAGKDKKHLPIDLEANGRMQTVQAPIERDKDSDLAEKIFNKTYGGEKGDQLVQRDNYFEASHGRSEERAKKRASRRESFAAKRAADEEGLAEELDDKTFHQLAGEEFNRLVNGEMKGQPRHLILRRAEELAKQQIADRVGPDIGDQEAKERALEKEQEAADGGKVGSSDPDEDEEEEDEEEDEQEDAEDAEGTEEDDDDGWYLGGPKSTDAVPSSLPTSGTERLETIPIERLKPHPDNRPLKMGEALEQLSASIKTLGIKQKPLVRPIHTRGGAQKPQEYQIIAGRRRIAAAQLAGKTEVTCVVEELSDAEALEIIAIENLQREDLNPIEQAQLFGKILALTDVGGNKIWTQQRLAAERGFSQPSIANALRLLKLPDFWQDLLIRQQITPAHAGFVLPWVEHPTLMKKLQRNASELLKHSDEEDPGLGTVASWRSAVDATLRRSTAPMTGRWYGDSTNNYKNVPWAIEPSESLQVIEVANEPRAMNTKAAIKLKEKAIDALRDKAVAKKAAKGSKGNGKPATKRAPTAAEKKSTAALQAKQYAARLKALKTDWLRYLVAGQIVEPSDGVVITKLLLFLAGGLCNGSISMGLTYQHHRGKELAGVLKGTSAKWDNLWEYLQDAQPSSVQRAMLAMIARCLWEEEQDASEGDGSGEPSPMLPPRVVEGLADLLSIDLAEAWRQDHCGPLTERYYNLHTKDQLIALGKEIDVFVPANASKAGAIQLFMGPRAVSLRLPKELAREVPKPVKGKSAKAAKAKPKTAKTAKKKKGARK
jgi:ParB/RepB/Spo0J family partition protein